MRSARFGAAAVCALVAWSALFCAASPAPAAATPPTDISRLFLDGVNSPQTHGKTFTIDSPADGVMSGNWSAWMETPGDSFSFAIAPTDQALLGLPWNLTFSAPPGQLLQAGETYEGEWSPSRENGLAYLGVMGGTGTSCTTTSSTFTVQEVQYDTSGVPEIFSANFIQWCGVDSIRGEIRFHSSFPLVSRDITPTAITFPIVQVGDTGPSIPMTFVNAGTADLHIGRAVVDPPFTIVEDGCAGRLLSGTDSCEIQVASNPTGPGSFSGWLTTSDDSMGSGHRIQLVGSGRATTVTTLTSSRNPNIYPDGGTLLSATVTPTPDGSGRVTFCIVGGSCLSPQFTHNGIATVGYNPPSGTVQIVARFEGRQYFSPSESQPLTQSSKRRYPITIFADPIIAPPGHPIAVGADFQGSVPGGTMTLTDEATGQQIGTVSGDEPFPLIWACRRPTEPGVHRIRADYTGFGPDVVPSTAYIDVTIQDGPVTRGPTLTLGIDPGPIYCASVTLAALQPRVSSATVALQPRAIGQYPFSEVRISNSSEVDALGQLVHGTVIPYGSDIDWSLIDPLTGGQDIDGEKWISYQFHLDSGAWSGVWMESTVLDRQAPTGSVVIASGTAFAQSPSVSLDVSADDVGSWVTDVALSNDGTTWTTRTYAPTQAWTLTAMNGPKIVYVKWKDSAGNWSAVKSDTIVLDTVAPAGSISVGGGAAYTATVAVTVGTAATDGGSGMSQVALSNDGSVWTTRPYGPSQSWILAPTNGIRTVYAKWKDVAGNWSAARSDTIVLDTTGPTGAVSVAGGVATTRSTAVTLSTLATDTGSGMSQVALSNDGTAWTTRSYAASQAWTLPATNGTRTVYAKWKDALGNWSAVKTDTIVLDTAAPTASSPSRSLLAGTAISGGSVRIRLGWTASDTTSGVARYELQQSTDGGAWSSISTTLTSPTLDRSLTTQHRYTFRVRAIDKAGNTGAWATGPTAWLSRYSETSPSMAYTGSWHQTYSGVYYGGGAKWSATGGAKATFNFTGRSIAFVSRLGPTKGRARIYLDGALVVTLDLYASSYQSQRVAWARNFAAAGKHSVSVIVMGTPTRPRVDVDAFVVGG
jgi:hypothetical protein